MSEKYTDSVNSALMGSRIVRFKIAWRAFFGGAIGPVGWCGQVGYWWTRPCGHPAAGCGWFDGERVKAGSQ